MLSFLTAVVALLALGSTAHLLLTLALVRRLRLVEAGAGAGAARPPVRRWPAVGTPVGDFSATTVSGTPLTAADFQGRDRLVLFLKAGCGPCDEIVASLQDGPGTPPAPAAVFVVGEAGTAEADALVAKVGTLAPTALIHTGASAVQAFGQVAVYPTVLRVSGGAVAAAGGSLDAVLPSPAAVR